MGLYRPKWSLSISSLLAGIRGSPADSKLHASMSRKLQPAHELLAPVCEWFTKGFDTRDLKEAKALPEELAH